MSEQEKAIVVQDVTKKFKVYLDKSTQLKDKFLFWKRNRYEDRLVLRGINFEVDKGEAIGLIGKNGCGKSTTLKLLTRIIYPDSGTIKVNGRVSSLIELGAGFHPDMSGRENIYTNASIFGLTKKEIDARLDEIIRFSEMEEFLDNPVRTYSSGMYMRLAFSIAINVNADVLLIDEILAVGDVNFQIKCFDKLKEIKNQGTTIVIVSHSLNQIEQICDRTLWIQDGVVYRSGVPKEIHSEYLGYMEQKRQENIDKEYSMRAQEQGKKRWGNGKAKITEVGVYDSLGKKKHFFETGDSIQIKVAYEVNSKVEDAVFGFGIFSKDGKQCYGTNTRIDNLSKFNLEKGGGMCLNLENVNLLPGEYYLDLAIESGDGVPVDYYREVTIIRMFSIIKEAGIARIDHTWEF